MCQHWKYRKMCLYHQAKYKHSWASTYSETTRPFDYRSSCSRYGGPQMIWISILSFAARSWHSYNSNSSRAVELFQNRYPGRRKVWEKIFITIFFQKVNKYGTYFVHFYRLFFVEESYEKNLETSLQGSTKHTYTFS